MNIREFFSARDMTEGAPWKRIAEFAIPMLIGNLAQQLYNTVDAIVVGKYVGDNALAAVGTCLPILNLLLALFVGISTGAGVLISQRFGAGDREGLSEAIGNCITMAAIASLIAMILGLTTAKPLLRLLGTPPSVFDWCTDYLTIFLVGGVGFVFYNILSGILRGLGDSFSALGFLLIATVLNIALDVWFVAGFGMGVPGVALATVLAQGISAVLCFLKLLHMRRVFDLNLSVMRLQRNSVLKILRLGVPTGVSQCIIAMATMMVQSLTNSMGEVVMACNVIIMRVDGFAMMPNMTFGQAVNVYIGQNVGAKRMDRVDQGLKQGLIMAVSVSALITVILLFFGRYLFDMFTDTPTLMELAVRMMRIIAPCYVIVAVTQTLGGVMRGSGDTMTPMWLTMLCSIPMRIPVAYGLAHLTRSAEFPNGRPEAIYISLLVVWSAYLLLIILAFRRGKWREKALQSGRRDAEAPGL